MSAMVRRSRVKLFAATLLLYLALGDLPAQSIFTVAGGATSDGRPATLVGMNHPVAVVRDRDGNLYIAEYFADRIRRVTPDGLITTFAGDGSSGFRGDGGPAVEATVDSPEALALDDDGNLYIAGTIGSRIYKIDRATGILHWIGGNGLPIFSGDGGPAKNAGMYEPTGIAVDGNRNVFVAIERDHRVRKIHGSTGIITTIAGNGTPGFSGDGGPAGAAMLKSPKHLAVDSAGNLYIADSQNHRVRRIDAATGRITTIGGNGSTGYSGDGGAATATALGSPGGVAVDEARNVFVTSGNRLRRIDGATGTITTMAGTGSAGYSGDAGPAAQARIWTDEIEVDAAGNLYLAEGQNNRVRQIQSGLNTISTIAGNGKTSTTGDGGPAVAAEFAGPKGMVVDRSGNLYVADRQAHRIRKIDLKTGIISTIAGTGSSASTGDGGPAISAQISSPTDVALDANGNVYLVEFTRAVRRIDALTGRISNVFSVSLFVDYIDSLAVDGSGNVYVSDYNNHVVLKKPPGGAAFVYAGNRVGAGNQYVGSYSGDGGLARDAGLNRPRGLAIDGSGNLLIADSNNHRIRRVDATTGIITTVAGSGPIGAGAGRHDGDGSVATNARLHAPGDVAVDLDGNLLITELARIRKVDATTRIITTVAGSGDSNFTGDGGRATEAGVRFPESVAPDTAGNFFLSDGSNRVRGVFACVNVSVPSLTSPSDGSTGVALLPRLAWSAVPGAFRYDLLLDTTSPSEKVVAEDLTSTSYSPANLQPLTRYYWQVAAKGDPFCSPFSSQRSAVRSFTTASVCGSPAPFALQAPLEAEDGVAASVDLRWESSLRAAKYDLYLGTSNPPALLASDLDAPRHALSGLAPGVRYFWYVAARAGCDLTRTTTTAMRSFRVGGSCAPPGAVALAAPADGGHEVAVQPILSWAAATNAAGYDVFFGRSLPPPLFAVAVAENRLELPRLLPGTTYYWQVVARDGCDGGRPTTSSRFSFQVTQRCEPPAAPRITRLPQEAAAGQTYTIDWSESPELEPGGSYVVERSTGPAFATIIDSQQTTSSYASFLADRDGIVYHRVRAIRACDETKASASSEAKLLTIARASPNVIFTSRPEGIITKLGDKLEEQKASFTIENLGTAPVQVLVGRQEIQSVPFFYLIDPAGGDSAFVTLDPRMPKRIEVRFSGPPNNQPGNYQGMIVLAGTGQPLATNPLAYVSLKVGGDPAAAPLFAKDGEQIERIAFPPFAGDDAARPPITVDILNGGSAPMDLVAEISPELWLRLEKDWNALPVPANNFRPIRLSTQRNRAVHGSALPRFTWLTVRNRNGQSARLLVEDNGTAAAAEPRAGGRSPLQASFIVPTVVSEKTRRSRIRISNVGTEAVEVELQFTPAGADPLDASAVKRAALIVPRNEIVSLVDPIVQTFALSSPGSGHLEVHVAEENRGFMIIDTAVERDDGTYAGLVPVIQRGEGATPASPHVLAMPPGPGARRLTLLETSARDGAKVRVVVFDSAGNRREERSAEVPPAGRLEMANIPAGPGRIELLVDGGGGSVCAVLTIEEPTGSAAAWVSQQKASPLVSPLGRRLAIRPLENTTSPSGAVYIIPVIESGWAPLPSDSGRIRTDLTLTAPGDHASSFKLTYSDAANQTTTSRSLSLAAGNTTALEGVIEQLFGIAGRSYGSLLIETDSDARMAAGLNGDLQKGRVSEALPVVSLYSEAISGGGSAKPLYLDGLQHSVDASGGRRSDLLLTEVSGEAATVAVRLYEAGNRSQAIAEKTIALPARGVVRLQNLFAELGLETPLRRVPRVNVQCVVTVTSRRGTVAAAAETVDFSTGDTKVKLFVPAGGVAATGIQRTPAPSAPPAPPVAQPRRRAVGRK